MPLFNKEILKPVNAFMNRITPNKPFWRANWTVRPNRSLLRLAHPSHVLPVALPGNLQPESHDFNLTLQCCCRSATTQSFFSLSRKR